MDATAIETALRNHTISVESVSVGDVVDLAYLTAFPADRPEHAEIGRACRAFLELYEDEGWEPKPVHATILRAPDDVQATWRLEPEWIVDLDEYSLSEEAFTERVLGTLEAP